MKTTLAAIALTAISFQAQAQQGCAPLESINQQWQEAGIETNIFFSGLVDDGRLTVMFNNPENGRWSHWIEAAPQSRCFRLLGQGGAADVEYRPFTTKTAPEIPL